MHAQFITDRLAGPHHAIVVSRRRPAPPLSLRAAGTRIRTYMHFVLVVNPHDLLNIGHSAKSSDQTSPPMADADAAGG